MKLRSKLAILLVFSIVIALPQSEALANSSSGHINVDPNEWRYFPMSIKSGELFECSFNTDIGVLESFIVHEDYFVANTEISEQVLIYHSIDSSDDFQFTFPHDGDWFWVFINHGAITIMVTFQWESDLPNNVLAPFNLVLATGVLAAIFGLAGVLHFRKKGKKDSIG